MIFNKSKFINQNFLPRYFVDTQSFILKDLANITEKTLP